MSFMNLKRLFAAVIAGLMILSVATACQKKLETVNTENGNKAGDEDGQNDSQNDEQNDGQNGNPAAVPPVDDRGGVDGSIIPSQIQYVLLTDEGELAPEIIRAIELQKKNKGYIWFEQEGGKSVVVIFAGEKVTGGYAVELVSVAPADDRIDIVVKETAPDKDAMVIQAVTYPYIIVRIDAMPERILVQDEFDFKFENLVAFVPMFGEGKYIGQIDNNSVEIKVDPGYSYEGSGKECAFRLDVVSRQYFDKDNAEYKNIADGSIVEFSFYINENGQYVLNTIAVKS